MTEREKNPRASRLMNTMLERVDVNGLLDEIDLDRLLERVDLDRLLTRIDVNALMAQVDVDALMNRVDVEALTRRANVGELVSRGTGQVAGSTLDLARRQAVGLDRLIIGLVNKLLGRDAGARPLGPPGLVPQNEPESDA